MPEATAADARLLAAARVGAGLVAAATPLGLELAGGPLLAAPTLPPGVTSLALVAVALGGGRAWARAASARALALALVGCATPLVLVDLDAPERTLVLALAYAASVLVGASLGRGGGRAHARPGLVRLALAGGAAALLLAPAATPGALWLVLVPLGLVFALVGSSLVHLAQGTATELAGGAAHPAATPPHRLRSVTRELAPTLVALALLVPSLALLLTHLPRPSLALERLESFRSARTGADDGERASARLADTPFDGVFPDRATSSSAPTTLRQETVAWVRARTPEGMPVDAGPLYLRGSVLERFVRGGLEPAREPDPRPRTDAADGTRDGWTTLRGARGGHDLELEVAQAPVYLQGSAWSLLFAPAGLAAVDLSPVAWDPDRLLASLDVPATDSAEALPHRLRMRVVERRGAWLDLSDARVDLGRVDATALPPGRATERLRARAAALAGDESTPEQRLEAVLAYLRDGFVYDLRVEHPPGLDGVLRFLDSRRGFCTSYASAATALLRALGVPARVATGFCANDWDPDAAAYRVTTRQGHAWIEVPYAGLGWVVLDPTPPAERAEALASSARDPSASLGDWADELLHDLRRWRRLADRASWDELTATLLQLPRALVAGTGGRALVASAVALVALVALLLRRRRRRSAQRAAADPGAAGRRPEAPLETRLVRALAARGHRRGPADPLCAWTAAVARRDPVLAAAPRLAGWLQRARFGAPPLRPEERADAEVILAGWAEREA